ncbi:hypothetical protein K1719_045485 [Acacia pycnantha]|nr:hypothetical protein K1719_045485 [Acacia pycnantha]
MSLRNGGLDPQSAAEEAVAVIGLGYDVCREVRLSGCKARVVELPNNRSETLAFPGGVFVPDVSASIKCHPGESFRDFPEVLSFHQMSEHFNVALSLSGKVPSGLFNAMFDMRNSWKKDAASTERLAFDGWFITLYSVELDRAHITVSEHVKNQVPMSWNPSALAKFIEKYGTHIVVGVKMGGKDVVHMKQFKSSHLQPTEVQRLLKKEADKRFSEDEDGFSSSDEEAESFAALKEPKEQIIITPVQFLGSKLYVNTMKVDSGYCPVTAPVLYNGSIDDELRAIVTKAWLEVKQVKRKKVLFLRLGFSMVESAEIYRSEWDGSPFPFQKSGIISALMSTMLTKGLRHVVENENPTEDNIKPIVYNGESGTEAPIPMKAPKMLNFVDTKEKVRYSLLAIMSDDLVPT